MKQGERSVHPHPLRPLLGKQLLDCLEYPLPHRPPVQVALAQQLVEPHGSMARGLIAVLVNQQAG